MSIGARLKEERERLQLSQEELAKMAGVSRVTLGRYETDKRDIGSDFLDRISQFGMAVEYILTGRKLDERQKRTRALSRILHFLTKELQLDPAVMQLAIEEASADVEREEAWQDGKGNAEFLLTDMLKASPVLVLDPELFMQAVEAVVARFEQSQLPMLPPWKKAQVIVLLYRASKQRGRIDSKVLDDALLLADSSSIPPRLRERLNAELAQLDEGSPSEPAAESSTRTTANKVDSRGSAK